MDNSETTRPAAARKSSSRKGSDATPLGADQNSTTTAGSTPASGGDGPNRPSAASNAAPAQRLVDKMRDQASAQFAAQKDKATQGIGSVVQAVRQSTQQLREQQHETAAQYVEQIADQLDRFSKQLQEKDLNRLIEDAGRLARRQPALFVGGAFAVGLLGARFLKSSRPDQFSKWDRSSGAYRGANHAEVHDAPRVRANERRRVNEIRSETPAFSTADDIPNPETR